MPNTVADRVRMWSRDNSIDPPPQYLRIESQIDYLSGKLYADYEVTKYPPHLEFAYRLRDWLDSAPDEHDQKVMFQAIPRIFYIGDKEYQSLYRAAFNGPIARWLIDTASIDITKSSAQIDLLREVKATWFCAITDSMQLAKFYHVNNIEGADIRPEWRSLKELGDENKICSHMRDHGLKRIVLLEDFVGTGSQMKTTVDFAINLPENYPVMLCPLVICPSGNILGKTIESLSHGKVTYEPTLILDSSVILSESPCLNEDNLTGMLRNTVLKTYSRVAGTNTHQLYGPFGFGVRAEQGGLLVVMYTNCPDNTLPLIHHQSDSPWYPLFPRSSRL